jgi:hypothetical protein
MFWCAASCANLAIHYRKGIEGLGQLQLSLCGIEKLMQQHPAKHCDQQGPVFFASNSGISKIAAPKLLKLTQPEQHPIFPHHIPMITCSTMPEIIQETEETDR